VERIFVRPHVLSTASDLVTLLRSVVFNTALLADSADICVIFKYSDGSGGKKRKNRKEAKYKFPVFCG
jgi:hypothetical protein